MSIKFISGKPGGGKSMLGTKLIIDELLNGDRPVVTNLALNLGALNVYLQKIAPEKYASRFRVGKSDPIHIRERVLLIKDDDLATFFTFRGSFVRLESVSNDEWRNGRRPDFSKVLDAGVFYVLDEIHIAFNSRAWADTGHQVLFYLSQHRKLGDDLVCITQAVNNVDKQFRSVAQDFTYIRNLGKQKRGIFKLPRKFIWSVFLQPPTGTSVAVEQGWFSLDVEGLGSCYDTAAGVGIRGLHGADTKERRKGVSWVWFVIALPLVFWLFLHTVPKIAGHFLGIKSVIVQPVATNRPAASEPPVFHPPKQTNAETAETSPKLMSYATDKTNVVLREPLRTSFSENKTNEVFCLGYASRPDTSIDVFLSDGSTVNTTSGRISVLTRSDVTMDGVRIPIRQVRNETPTTRAATRATATGQQPVQSLTSRIEARPRTVRPTQQDALDALDALRYLNGGNVGD